MNIVVELIENFDPKNPCFRPTEIYNEKWLLKAFMHQASQVDLPNSPFAFADGAIWFSEALLPTAFQARSRGDRLGETRTNADAVFGHILIGEKGKADLELAKNACQFVVIEAKISARLSQGTKNAPEFDQAARTVACMAEVLCRANKAPTNITRLSFITLAPTHHIEAGKFSNEMDLDAIRRKIRDRVAAYGGDLDEWYKRWAEPTLDALSLHLVSWEHAIQALGGVNAEAASLLQEFYASCLEFN